MLFALLGLTVLGAVLPAGRADSASNSTGAAGAGVVTSYAERPWHCVGLPASGQLECICFGSKLTAVPQDMPAMHLLTIDKAAIEVLTNDSLHAYRKSLTDLHLVNLDKLHTIEPGIFSSLEELQLVIIHNAPQLILIETGVFHGLPSKFRELKIRHTSLERIPDMTGLGMGHTAVEFDLESNKIQLIDSNAVRVGAASFRLDYNDIQSVDAGAFNGSMIAVLSLRGNKRLQRLSLQAFAGIRHLRELDLSETSITELPVVGLGELETLRVENTRTMTTIPSIYSFKHLEVAWLTYAFHCCAFAFPAIHDPKRHEEYRKFMERMKEMCNQPQRAAHPEVVAGLADPESTVDSGDRPRQRVLREATSGEGTWEPWHADNVGWGDPIGEAAEGSEEGMWRDMDVTSTPGYGFMDGEGEFDPEGYPSDQADDGTLHQLLGTFHEEVQITTRTMEKICGNLTLKRPQPVCHPTPNALNPCEDIMGYSWLRGLVWIVVLATVTGNVAVLAVLLANLSTLTVPRFLMCHLALADLCMGLYLLLLAAMDLRSHGEYFNYACAWQVERGCAVAGFLTIFSSQLSIYTLCVITLERWFAITCAIDLNKRIQLGTAAQVMVAGWVYAIIMAALPLVGVSSYSSTSICLPMDSGGPASLAYVIVLLLVAALAFVVVLVSYLQIYLSLGPDTRRRRQPATRLGVGAGAIGSVVSSRAELSVANKMALLVLTDFTCWAPIAFFSLTALAGHPLISVTNSKILLVFFYPLNACANPFLYAILTKQYRKDLYALLGRCGICTHVAQRYKMQNFSTPTTNNSNQPLPMTVREAGNAGFCYDGPETLSSLLTPPSTRTNRIMSSDLQTAEPCLPIREEAFV